MVRGSQRSFQRNPLDMGNMWLSYLKYTSHVRTALSTAFHCVTSFGLDLTEIQLSLPLEC